MFLFGNLTNFFRLESKANKDSLSLACASIFLDTDRVYSATKETLVPETKRLVFSLRQLESVLSKASSLHSLYFEVQSTVVEFVTLKQSVIHDLPPDPQALLRCRRSLVSLVRMIQNSSQRVTMGLTSSEKERILKKEQKLAIKKMIELIKLNTKAIDKKDEASYRTNQMKIVAVSKELCSQLSDIQFVSALKASIQSYLRHTQVYLQHPTEENKAHADEEKTALLAILSPPTPTKRTLLKDEEKRAKINDFRQWVIQTERISEAMFPPDKEKGPQYWKLKYLQVEQDYLQLKHYCHKLFEELELPLDQYDWLTKLPLVNGSQYQGLPPLICGAGMFVAEKEVEDFNFEYSINFVEDIYRKEFAPFPHVLFTGLSSDPTPTKYIVAVLKQPRRNGHFGLTITKRGYTSFHFKTEATITKYISNEHFGTDQLSHIQTTPEIIDMVVNIEAKSPQIKTEFKIAVLYAKEGQTNPHDMFKNEPSEQFSSFLQHMNLSPTDKTINANKTWHHTAVTWYVATQLNSDEHRRDVGNAPSIIFFKDTGEDFDAKDIGNLGMVPQIMVVVQPFNEGYRVGFFRSGNMRPFGPPLPSSYVFHPLEIQEYILTKIYNGNVNFFYSSPMNRVFMSTRQAAIDAICDKAKKK